MTTFLVLKDYGCEGYSKEMFETKEDLEKWLNESSTCARIEIYEVVEQVITVKSSLSVSIEAKEKKVEP
jgi:hypothetical protein